MSTEELQRSLALLALLERDHCRRDGKDAADDGERNCRKYEGTGQWQDRR